MPILKVIALIVDNAPHGACYRIGIHELPTRSPPDFETVSQMFKIRLPADWRNRLYDNVDAARENVESLARVFSGRGPIEAEPFRITVRVKAKVVELTRLS